MMSELAKCLCGGEPDYYKDPFHFPGCRVWCKACNTSVQATDPELALRTWNNFMQTAKGTKCEKT